MEGKSILTMDPPKHTKMRAIVNKAFTPKAVKELEPHIEEVTAFLFNEAKQKDLFDVVDDLAAPFPSLSLLNFWAFRLKTASCLNIIQTSLSQVRKTARLKPLNRCTNAVKKAIGFWRIILKTLSSSAKRAKRRPDFAFATGRS